MLISTIFSTTANAAVIDYSIAKFQGFTQTADNTAPVTADTFQFYAQFATNNPNDFNTVSVDGAPGGSFALDDFGFDWERGVQFPTLTALNAAYPDQVYTFEASGTLGTFSEPLSLTGGFLASVPFFTGTVFSDLQGMDASQDFLLTWNSPPADGFGLFIIDLNTNSAAFGLEGFGDSMTTSVLIPGGTLTPGTNYEVVLDFIDASEGTVSSFSTGEEFTGFVNTTFLDFSTASSSVPEPAGIWLMASALVVLSLSRYVKRSA